MRKETENILDGLLLEKVKSFDDSSHSYLFRDIPGGRKYFGAVDPENRLIELHWAQSSGEKVKVSGWEEDIQRSFSGQDYDVVSRGPFTPDTVSENVIDEGRSRDIEGHFYPQVPDGDVDRLMRQAFGPDVKKNYYEELEITEREPWRSEDF